MVALCRHAFFVVFLRAKVRQYKPTSKNIGLNVDHTFQLSLYRVVSFQNNV